MIIEEAILTFLKSHSPLTAIVGQRVYTNHLPANPGMPAVILRNVSQTYVEHMNGPAGVSRIRLEISLISENYRETITTTEVIRQALHGFHGTLSTISIQGIHVESLIDLPEPPKDGSTAWTYRRAIDFSISHTM